MIIPKAKVKKHVLVYKRTDKIAWRFKVTSETTGNHLNVLIYKLFLCCLHLKASLDKFKQWPRKLLYILQVVWSWTRTNPRFAGHNMSFKFPFKLGKKPKRTRIPDSYCVELSITDNLYNFLYRTKATLTYTEQIVSTGWMFFVT